MKNVLFVTTSFPYPPGEQFIEDELRYWSSNKDLSLSILPLIAKGTPRAVPETVTVDLTLTKKNSRTIKACNHFIGLFSKYYWAELLQAYSLGRLSIPVARDCLRAVADMLRYKAALASIVEKLDGPVYVYSYWNNPVSFAAALLREEGAVCKLFSRLHGYDLYEQRTQNNHHPLKRGLLARFDKLLPVSAQGAWYLQDVYGLNKEKIQVLPLGVSIPSSKAYASADGCFNVISVSFCVPVKRLDKMVDAIEILSQRSPHLKINWVHIGGGVTLDEIRVRAERTLTGKNIKWEFFGNLDKSEVLKFYQSNPVDVFLNSSDSEGVPVSIMEAMSFGVPAIAPDVGGVSEIVDTNVGFLLPKNPTPRQIADCLLLVKNKCKDPRIRESARLKIVEFYNADINYQKLVNEFELF